MAVAAAGMSLLGGDVQKPLGLATMILLSAVIMVGLAWGMGRALSDQPRLALRLVPSTLRDTLTACAGIAGLGIATDALLCLLMEVFPSTFDDAMLRYVFDAFSGAGPVEGIVLSTCIAIGPGIAEELGFRGFVLRCFEEELSMPLAVLLSSLLFGLMHANVLQGVGAGLLGVYLGLVVWRTGSLLPAMAAHATNNLLSSINALQHQAGAPLFEARPLWMPACGLVVAVVAVARLRQAHKTPAS